MCRRHEHCDRPNFGHSVNISVIFSPLSRTLRLVPAHPHKAGLSVYRQNRWSTSTTPEQEMTSHRNVAIQDLICSRLLVRCSHCMTFLVVRAPYSSHRMTLRHQESWGVCRVFRWYDWLATEQHARYLVWVEDCLTLIWGRRAKNQQTATLRLG